MGWGVLVYGALAVIVLLTICNLTTSIRRLELKANRLELYLELLLHHMEVDVPSQLSDRIKQIALDPRRKIEAIKLLREETGMGLKDAKDAIEEFIATYPHNYHNRRH